MLPQRNSGGRMADQRLMCVWQTVDLQDPDHSASHGTARKVTVQEITASLSRDSRLVHYSQRIFQDNFPNSVVNFNDFVNYVKVCLRDHSVPFARVEEDFEILSWEMCKEYYSLHHCSVMECDVFKLWQIFNKLCIPGSMPPVIHFDDVQWLGLKFASSSKQRWSALHDGQLTFMEFLGDLDAMCFKSLNHGDVERVVSSVHSWLVREVCQTGWMSKRTRKQANWTTWQKRWFVLKPGLLTYYTDATLSVKKGDITLNNKSTVEDLCDLKTLLRHYPNRFRITNAPFIEIELSSEDMIAKDRWMSSVLLVIRAAKLGTSPSQVKLADTRKQYAIENYTNDDSSNRTTRVRRSDGEDDDEDELDGQRRSGGSGQGENGSARSSSSDDSKMVYCLIISTIGRIWEDARAACGHQESFTLASFRTFFNQLNLDISEDEMIQLFSQMQSGGTDDHLAITDYVQFVLRLILLEDVPSEPAARRFLCAILAIGSGFSRNLGQFDVFIDSVWNRQRVHYVRLLNEVLNNQDGDAEDTITLIRQAFSREQSILGTILDSPDAEKAQDLETLYSQMKMDPNVLSQYLHQKWDEYPEKSAPEKHPNRIAQDRSLLDIVCYTDILPSVPQHCVIYNFRWKRPSVEGKLGIALFPRDFDGNIFMGKTTQEELFFYGARLADQTQIDTSLIYQHGSALFGELAQASCDQQERPACLRFQDEGTLLCPLQEDSGILILGKQEGSTLLLTGFKIPVFSSVYIPRNTIYCVDYTRGRWRRMINIRATIDHAQMLQKQEDADDDESDGWPRYSRTCSLAFDSCDC